MIPPAPGRPTASGGGRHRARPRTRLLRLVFRAGPAAAAGTLALAMSLPSAGGPAADTATELPPGASATGPDGGLRISLAESGLRAAVPAPTRVRIPSIGVDSELALLGVDGAGVLVPPTDFDRAGWFSGSPLPGEVGPAVIAGHVDSRDGPAVFFRLRDLVPGDAVLVDRADGSTARFTVSGADRYPKDGFPTQDVYGATPRAELRLITCGGAFDRDRRSYVDNVVVSAVLTG